MASNCREAIAALAADTAERPLDGVYVRDRVLFRPVRVADLGTQRLGNGGVKRLPEALVLVSVEPAWLLTRLADITTFVKFDARKKRLDVTNPPPWMAAAILAQAPWPALPVLHGAVQAPTLRADGSVLEVPGYDGESRLLFDPGGRRFRKSRPSPRRSRSHRRRRS